jgi:hypothetical protein
LKVLAITKSERVKVRVPQECLIHLGLIISHLAEAAIFTFTTNQETSGQVCYSRSLIHSQPPFKLLTTPNSSSSPSSTPPTKINMAPKKDTNAAPETAITGYDSKETKLLAAAFVSSIGVDKVRRSIGIPSAIFNANRSRTLLTLIVRLRSDGKARRLH